MLKTCFLPAVYPNNINKACGEIICQTETTFSITCKLCSIKIFDYDEFIEHFRNTHLPEICYSNENRTRTKYNHLKTFEWESISSLGNDVEGRYDILQEKQSDTDVEETITNVKILNEAKEPNGFLKPLAVSKKASSTSGTIKEKRFECSQCSRKFTTKFYLSFHIRQQHEPKKFQCEKCNKSFVEKRYLTLHQRTHTGYICQVCNKPFDKYEALRYHGESHIQTRNFICNYEKCGKTFPNNRRLSAHKRSHFAQPTFVCEICGSRQRSKEFLIVHIRTHTGEKPYACNQCDRRFASKHFLQDHQSVHATERTHVCTVCGKTFASSKSLYHHRHLHSDVKKYVCKICHSAYSQAAGLSAHMRKHKQNFNVLNSQETNGGSNKVL